MSISYESVFYNCIYAQLQFFSVQYDRSSDSVESGAVKIIALRSKYSALPCYEVEYL